MMASQRIYIISFALLWVLCGVITDALATHTSKPILIDPETDYIVGSTVIIRGWIDYNAQPTPDVPLNFKLTRPDRTLAVDQTYPSDQEGRFEFKFDTKNAMPGIYQLTITSHCLEIHRYACTYQNQTLSIHLNNP
jgi:hypothetical protein